MKKLNLILWIFILFGSLLSGQAWETKVKEFVYGDATYYTALSQEVSVELDCVNSGQTEPPNPVETEPLCFVI